MARPLPTAKKAFNGILRLARAEDLPAIVQIENESFGDERWSTEDLGAALEYSIEEPRAMTLVVAFGKAASPASNDNSEPAGYGLGQMETPTQGVVMSMAVANNFRGQGLGRQLLDEVVENLRQAGAQKIVLQVEATNKVAISLYESSGFVYSRNLRNYYGRGRDGNLMVRDLKAPKP
jgi:ribosomal-protein-alanine N-acetyltransferase